jgi:GxxExxY protein
MTENQIGKVIVDTALHLHKRLGPGLLETVYEVILAYELKKRQMNVERQVQIPILYEGIQFEEGFRADIIVNDKVIIELKSVEALNNAHKKQLLTYLKLMDMKLGFLLNFSEELMKDGITRVINGFDL